MLMKMMMNLAGHQAHLNRSERDIFSLDIRNVSKNIDKKAEKWSKEDSKPALLECGAFFIVSICFVVK